MRKKSFLTISIHTIKYWYMMVKAYKRSHSRQVTVLSLLCLILVITLAVLLFYIQLSEAFQLILKTGWIVFLLPTLFLIWNLAASFGWQRIICATSEKIKLGLFELTSIRIQGQAINTVLPLSGIGGEVLRSAKLVRQIGLSNSVFTVSLDKGIDFLAEIVLGLLGIAAFTRTYTSNKLYLTLIIISVMIFLFVPIFWNKLWRNSYKHWPFSKNRQFLAIYAQNKQLIKASRQAYFCHIGERLLIMAEIYVASAILDTTLDLHALLVLNSISSIVNILFLFIPGRIGSFECSLVFGFKLLNLPETTGLSVAILKRARQIIFCFAGIALIFINRKSSSEKQSVPKQEQYNNLLPSQSHILFQDAAL